jgi:hypothetical protein
MQPKNWLWLCALLVSAGLVGAVRAAAPVAPSYRGAQEAMEEIRRSWSGPGAQTPESAPGWNALFDALLADLQTYSRAESDEARQEALDRIEQTANLLATVSWPAADRLKQELDSWLSARLRLAQAQRRLTETLAALPQTDDPKLKANRAQWLDFVKNGIGSALRAYEAAESVSQRQLALDHVHEALDALKRQEQHQTWAPAFELLAALSAIFNQPNVEILADVATVAPIFERNLVETGPVTRKGYTSQVTAGQKTGFGLLPSDDGVAFFNSQQYVSVTPIWDFQNQVASNPQGQRAARLYQFSATTYDSAELTVTVVLRGTGLDIAPSYRHAIDASISSAPTCEGGFGRAVAGLIGMNQQAINNRVYEGSIGQFRQRIPQEALEEGQERIAVEQSRRNADLRKRLLVSDNVIGIRNFLLTQLRLRSRPDAAQVGGVLEVRNAPRQRGADTGKPSKLQTSEPGVTANIHVGSLLSSAAAAAYEDPQVRGAQNVMIVIKDVPPGTPPRDAYTLERNADFATYAKAVQDVKKAPNSKATALRITRPEDPPNFITDARGFLVALVRDLQVEVPAPPQEARGGPMGAPAQIYRIKLPLAEIALSYQVEVGPEKSLRVRAKVEDFAPGPNAQVWAIDRDESKAASLSRFSTAIIVSAMVARLRSQPIDVTLDQSRLPGFTIRSISAPDPTGWVHVGLVRDPNAPPPAISQR